MLPVFKTKPVTTVSHTGSVFWKSSTKQKITKNKGEFEENLKFQQLSGIKRTSTNSLWYPN